MRRACVLLSLGALVASCRGTPAPAAPVAVPHLAASGGVFVNHCVAGVNRFDCATYSGTVTNTGPGCGIHARGVTTTYAVGTHTPIGSSAWTYPNRVLVGESISYLGTQLEVPAPLNGGWQYVTTITADPVACP
jgi:hypothetical protein